MISIVIFESGIATGAIAVLIAIGVVVAVGNSRAVADVAHHHLIDSRTAIAGSDGVLGNCVVAGHCDEVVVAVGNSRAVANVAHHYLIDSRTSIAGGDGILVNCVVARPGHE